MVFRVALYLPFPQFSQIIEVGLVLLPIIAGNTLASKPAFPSSAVALAVTLQTLAFLTFAPPKTILL
jgi:hypothetical protein